MKPKEYLQQYRQSMERTAEIEQHLAELKAEAIRLKDHEGYSVKLDDATAIYVDACDEMSAELNRLAALRQEIKQTIETVSNARLRSMLTEIYINGQTLVRIAADKNYSYEHICRLHGEALRRVSEIMRIT